jgi:hypothetical protein
MSQNISHSNNVQYIQTQPGYADNYHYAISCKKSGMNDHIADHKVIIDGIERKSRYNFYRSGMRIWFIRALSMSQFERHKFLRTVERGEPEGVLYSAFLVLKMAAADLDGES